MESRHIGRIVTGCLTGGVVVAVALVLGPVAGAQEHVITGTILLTFAASWAVLGTLSDGRLDVDEKHRFSNLIGKDGVRFSSLAFLAPWRPWR